MQSILSLDSPTVVLILAGIIILVGVISIVFLILKKHAGALISLSLLMIIYGVFLIIIDRILVHYIDYDRLNRAEGIVIIVLALLFILQNWKKKKVL